MDDQALNHLALSNPVGAATVKLIEEHAAADRAEGHRDVCDDLDNIDLEVVTWHLDDQLQRLANDLSLAGMTTQALLLQNLAKQLLDRQIDVNNQVADLFQKYDN